jgi:glutamine amidotransferase
MQILARTSEEGSLPGLGWIDADVKALKSSEAAGRMPLPHMGWNDVRPNNPSPLFKGLETDARFYFLHAYYVSCDRRDDVLASCDYGVEFGCAIQHANVYGVQFHPEKSHGFGNRLLKNFAEL